MTGLDTDAAVAWIRRTSDLVAQQANELSSLDSEIGDGDHGANMSRGLQAAVEALDQDPPTSGGKALVVAGRAVVSKTGGASGPLYGTGFRKAGKALDAATDGSATAIAEALQAMLDAICELGGASEGDKTMIDALGPAANAAREAAEQGYDPAGTAAAAAEAADAGRVATVPMRARKGRASYLGERSVGHEDPGAASMALVVKALAETVQG